MRTVGLALLATLLVSLASVRPGLAQSTEHTTDGWATALKWGACAVSIALAPTGTGVVVAVVACLPLLFESGDAPAGDKQ